MTLKELFDTASDPTSPNFCTEHGTDKNTRHCYIDRFYAEEFAKWEDKELKLLEIGISGGGSLFMWGKYFTKGQIYGVDVNNQVLEKFKGLPNVHHYFTDGYSQEFANTLPNFDIIIDDGPHTLDSQVRAIQLYLPKLNPGGVFIIEDVQHESWFNTLLENTPEPYRSKAEALNFVHKQEVWDDMLFVIRS
jgi:8-demethyl-8-alpha-L-rhamnosyltetracenomycin-C 2'-O-methyltransferase